MSELLIGAGTRRKKGIFVDSMPRDWVSLTTLDINPDHKPDMVWDLNERPLPFDDDSFDEIHAYEVLEHLGRQGDWRSFFAEWSEWWRILKPGGVIAATSPHWQSCWAWGDPGHTRIISAESLVFLVQPQYTQQIGKTPMSDYRFVYTADFEPVHLAITAESFVYVMRAVKPSRCSL